MCRPPPRGREDGKDCGVQAFTDQSRGAHRQANRLPAPIEATIVRLKREYPGWGAPKIREKLRQQFHRPPPAGDQHRPRGARSRPSGAPWRRSRPRATGTELSRPSQPNALWYAAYKGEFLLGNRRDCYPLTITDFASRYLLTCEALSTTQEKFAFTVFERTFKEFGLPQVMRTDNGVPFASAHASHVEARSDEAGRRERAPAAGPVPRLSHVLEHGQAAPGAGDEGGRQTSASRS